jgi:hypothetical protein
MLFSQEHKQEARADTLSSTLVTSLEWKTMIIDLGSIKHMKPATVEFEMTNRSRKPVAITGVQVSCGCTAAEHSVDTLQPGASSKITVTYNAASLGAFKKIITVMTDASEPPYLLKIVGTVVADK